ncbi:MAG: signal peptidase II [Acidimicrobiales bacterium]|nr:signal peptidase II [Acidimicrobiales bacterium]
MSVSNTRSEDSVVAEASAAHRALVAAVAAVVIAADQLSKWWALNSVADRTIQVVWTLQLHVTRNTGAAFSMFSQRGWGPVIGVVALIVVGLLVWQGRTITNRTGAVAVGLILGGALGNLADRLFRAQDGFLSGAVVDFIDLQWWPVFNVADAGVVVGSILLVLVTLFIPDDAAGR